MVVEGRRLHTENYTGELTYLLYSFSKKTVAVDPHPDHCHAPHTTTSHQHTIASDTHDGHDHGGGTSTYGTGSAGNTGDEYSTTNDSAGTSPQGSEYTHKHGGLTGSAGSETLTHSGVKDASDGTSTAPSGVLNHTVTGLEGAGNVITYCDGASQSAIGNITQQVPKYPTEDGTAMDAGINETKYHDLGSFGDVYLVWKVDLENVGGEVEKCWVQVGDPAGSGIKQVPMGNSTTDRRAAGDPKVGTGQPEGDDEGVFKMKIGTVTESNEITQLVSSDVVWSPTVMDRVKI